MAGKRSTYLENHSGKDDRFIRLVWSTTVSWIQSPIAISQFFNFQDQTFPEFFQLTTLDPPYTLIIDGNISLVRKAVCPHESLFL
jgi:hypothetical protein